MLCGTLPFLLPWNDSCTMHYEIIQMAAVAAATHVMLLFISIRLDTVICRCCYLPPLDMISFWAEGGMT